METAADFPAYRRADVFFHLGLAEAAHAPRLVAAMTEVQAGMSELIGHIAHPQAVLARSNAQHARLITYLERRDGLRAVRLVREHLEGTEHILAGLMPSADVAVIGGGSGRRRRAGAGATRCGGAWWSPRIEVLAALSGSTWASPPSPGDSPSGACSSP